MSIFKRILPLLVISLFLFLPYKTHAAQFMFSDQTIKQETTIEDDVYIIGGNANVYGVVDGDLFVFSDTVNIEGTITGDLYIAGADVTIDGNIYGNLLMVANEAKVNGLLNGNAYLISTLLTYTAQTGKDVLTISADSDMSGSIADDLRILSVRNTTDTTVKGDVVLLASQYNILKENITGNIYNSSTITSIAKGQGVDLKGMNIEKKDYTPQYDSFSLKLVAAFIGFVSMSLVGYVLVYLSPVKTGQLTNRIAGSTSDFVKSFLFGFAILILIPFPLFLLLISVVATPLALLLIGTIVFITTFGAIYVEVALGKEILELFGQKEYRPYKSLLAGRTLTALVSLIPIVGSFYTLVLSCTALGAFVRMKKGHFDVASQMSKKKKRTTKKK